MSGLRDLTLYVIRHGESQHNVEGRNSGQNDSPLTERGRRQAAENGQLLKEIAGDTLERFAFFASPIHRTCVTMEIIRHELGLPRDGYQRDRRLMECDFGDWTGRKVLEVAQSEPDAMAAREADKWDFRIPGGESQHDLYARVGKFLFELTGDAVLVCHAGSMRMVRAHYLGLSPEETVYYTPDNSGVLRLSAGSGTHFEA